MRFEELAVTDKGLQIRLLINKLPAVLISVAYTHLDVYKRQSIESTVEVVYESEPSSEEVVLDKLPLMDVIENGALLEALQTLNERERQIFLARTLEAEDFEPLGVKFELSYNCLLYTSRCV